MTDNASRCGLGVLINMLSGNQESAEVFSRCIGKTITAMALDHASDPEALRITFSDATRLVIRDDGQSCCESRYMTTDDDLEFHVGATLESAEVRPGSDSQNGDFGDVHEIEFLVVTTSKGQFTIETHNQHSGYYGGFSIRCSEETAT